MIYFSDTCWYIKLKICHHIGSAHFNHKEGSGTDLRPNLFLGITVKSEKRGSPFTLTFNIFCFFYAFEEKIVFFFGGPKIRNSLKMKQ